MPYKSDKQRRLMQAVAHNAAFAEKVDIPQSVGKKFEAHKAKGGKVSAIEALLRRLLPEDRERLTAILNEEPDLEPLLGQHGATQIALSGHPPVVKPHEDLEDIGFDFLNPTPVALMEPQRFRDLALPIREGNFGGRASSIAQAVSENKLQNIPDLGIDKFGGADPGVIWHDGRGRSAALESLGLKRMPVLMSINRPSAHKLSTVQQKIDWLRARNKLLPEKEEGDMRVFPGDRGYDLDPVDISDVKLFADGGRVPDNLLPKLSGLAAVSAYTPGRIGSPEHSQQFAEGLLAQIYGLNDKGEPEFLGGDSLKHWPGIVDETLSLPTLLPERFTPEFAKRAAARTEELHSKIYRDMGIKPADDIAGGFYNAAGTMAGQIPTGGAKAVEGGVAKAAPGLLRKIGNVVKVAGEWFSPTVEAKPANYLSGVLLGGAGNAAGLAKDEEHESQGVNEVSRYAAGGVAIDIARMKGRYAGGGSASALRAINSAISAIESGDHSAAVSLLQPHKGNTAVAEVLKTLGEPGQEEE